MNDLLQETNVKLQEIVNGLDTLKGDYVEKITSIDKEIEDELTVVKNYKEEFFAAKEKIEKANNEIETFETEYNSLLEKFKEDELGSILLNTNKELEVKINEKKQKIIQDKRDINALIQKAEFAKNKLVKLTAEKKILEVRSTDIQDIFDYYKKAIDDIVAFTQSNEKDIIVTNKRKEEEAKQKAKEEEERRKEEERKAKEAEKEENNNGKKKKNKDNKDGNNEEPTEGNTEEPVNNEEPKKEEVKDEFGITDDDEITFDFSDLEKLINFDDNLDQ